MIAAPIRIYCDGACSGNQYQDERRKARSAAYFPDLKLGVSRDLEGPWEYQTNQRAEVDAVILALETLEKRGKGAKIEAADIYCDSLYAMNFAQKKWKVDPKKAKNLPLIQRLQDLVARFPGSLRFFHVKGHSGIPENEMVDQLATGKVKDFGSS